MKDRDISLPESLDAFVQDKIATGGYASASEVVSEGLILLRQQDAERVRGLRVAIREGLTSGEGRLLDDISVEEIGRRGRERQQQSR